MKKFRFNENLGMDMPSFLAGMPKNPMTREDRERVWEIMLEGDRKRRFCRSGKES